MFYFACNKMHFYENAFESQQLAGGSARLANFLLKLEFLFAESLSNKKRINNKLLYIYIYNLCYN